MRTVTVLAVSLAAMTAWGADANPPMVVSAASSQIGVTADSLASIYGDKLATVTEAAGAPPWPARLGDMSVVWISDSANQSQMAALIYVSPSQMNIWLPPGIAPGPATVKFPVTDLPPGAGTAALRVVPVTIQKVAPGLFSADGSGAGVAAASAVRVVIPTRMQGPVPVFSCDPAGRCAALPIDVGIDAPVYLTLYGTGIRGASSPANVVVNIGGLAIQPTWVGPQPQYPGLDQVNVPLLLSLRGRGLVDVTVTVDGVTSNAVQIRIQ